MKDIRLHLDQIEAILFDLDGTLIDTDDKAVERLAARLRPILGRGAPRAARWMLMKAESPGNALVTFLDFLGIDERTMAFTDWLRRRRGVYPARQFNLIDGVHEALLELHMSGHKLGIVTTRSRYHLDRFQEQFPRISSVMSVTCGLQDTRRLKPHPAPILLAMERLNVRPQHCLMVGDTTVDVKAARRAGVWSGAVLCGFGERRELERAGAHFTLKSTADLGQFLRTGNATPPRAK